MQWTWKAYKTSKGTSVVTEWRESVSATVWTEFRASVEFLDGQPPVNWTRPYIGKLRHDCKGLIEIRFDHGNVQYRPIGFYSGKQEFTILFFATEKGGKFVPLAACEIAQRRRNEIEKDKEKSREWWFKKRNR
jgi:hypothetical protein